MIEFYRLAVKALADKSVSLTARRIERISNDRMSDISHMRSDLMRSSRFEKELKICSFRISVDYLKMRDRRLSVLGYYHLSPVTVSPADWSVYSSLIMGNDSVYYCSILSYDFMACDHLRHLNVSLVILDSYHQT